MRRKREAEAGEAEAGEVEGGRNGERTRERKREREGTGCATVMRICRDASESRSRC